MRFDLNVSILLADVPVYQRPRAAADLGFSAIEMWWPFSSSVPAGSDIDRLVHAIEDANLKLVLLNLDNGSADRGEHGFLCVPGQESRWRENLDAATEISGRLGGCVLNALYGNTPDEGAAQLCAEVAAENLRVAAPRVALAGCQIGLEALNPVDFARYGLHSVDRAVEIARSVDPSATHVGIIFDVYNVQRSDGNLLQRVSTHAPTFVHVQIADVPDRLRPGTGEVDFELVLPAIDQAGYRGFVGLEYRPSPTVADSYSWLPPEARANGCEVSSLFPLPAADSDGRALGSAT